MARTTVRHVPGVVQRGALHTVTAASRSPEERERSAARGLQKDTTMQVMNRTLGFGLATAVTGSLAIAQPPPPPAGQAAQPMSFFVTSAGSGNGANLGGLAGADRALPDAGDRRGARRQDVARVSEHAGGERPAAVNARDRIGAGPWYNAQGRAHRAERRRSARRHARAGAPRQQRRQADGAHREGRRDQRRRRHAEPARHADRLAARRHRVHRRARITPAATGRAARRPAARSSGITIAPAAATRRGTRRIRAAAAARRTWSSTGGAGLFYCFAVN